MKFRTAHATCKGGKVHRDSNVTWKTDGNGQVFDQITHASVADAGRYMSYTATTKGADK